MYIIIQCILLTWKNCCNFWIAEMMEDIAFTVSLTNGGTQWANKKIMYDKIITNVGHGYSQQTGTFTCPKAGLYVFTWSTMSGSDSANCYADIYRNGEKSLRSYSWEYGGSGNEVASNTEVFHLSIGDQILIQTETCGYFHAYPLTAFSGWKLWKYVTKLQKAVENFMNILTYLLNLMNFIFTGVINMGILMVVSLYISVCKHTDDALSLVMMSILYFMSLYNNIEIGSCK